MHISYIEIYNDVAYDLLNVASGTSARLPKVQYKHSLYVLPLIYALSLKHVQIAYAHTFVHAVRIAAFTNEISIAFNCDLF